MHRLRAAHVPQECGCPLLPLRQPAQLLNLPLAAYPYVLAAPADVHCWALARIAALQWQLAHLGVEWVAARHRLQSRLLA